jgi:hypothetical protein
MPRPEVVSHARELTAAQRRVLVGDFKYACVVVAPLCEWVFVFADPIDADFGTDESSIEDALRAIFREKVAPGFS